MKTGTKWMYIGLSILHREMIFSWLPRTTDITEEQTTITWYALTMYLVELQGRTHYKVELHGVPKLVHSKMADFQEHKDSFMSLHLAISKTHNWF